MRCRLLLVPAIALALLAGACGDDDQQARTTGDSRSTSTTAGEQDDRGAQDDLPDGVVDGSKVENPLLTLDVHGGFVPVEVNVGNTAEVVVLSDHRVISGAPTIAIYPGPALPAFQVSTADRGRLDEAIAGFEALDPDADYDQGTSNQVADAPFTTVTLHDEGRTTSITGYALGMGDATGPRAALQAVVDRINGLATATGETPYEPTALRVHDVTEQAGPRPEPTPGEPSGTVRDWPIPHSGAACSVVSEPAQVRAALEVLRASTQLDWFRTDVGERRLVVVPLLPGDPGCPRD